MDKFEIYKYANNNIIDLTGKDSTSNLLKEYAVYGMYNLLSALDYINGSVENTKMVALPDFTFSRNENRWKAGYPYGSVIKIDSNGIPFIPLGFRPNCCGISMCKIAKRHINPEKIVNKIEHLANLNLDLGEDDLKRGNHFIGIYYDKIGDEYYAIIHGSFNFVKSGYHDLPGLYIDKTPYWNDKKKIFKTDYTSFEFLIDEDAVKYYDLFKNYENITKTLREKITKYIFEDCDILLNETHEGLYDSNTIVLGAYVKAKPYVCPIMLSAETDLPIVNIDKSVPQLPGELYICPHGGGYYLSNVIDGHYDGKTAKYKLTFENNANMITSDIRNLIYTYRTNTDKIWLDQFHFGTTQKRLETVYNFKL